jgi:hypothetical protein
MKTILLTLLLASTALAEDCYNYNPYMNRAISHIIQYRKAPANVSCRAIIRRSKQKNVLVLRYFVTKGKKVTATSSTLGWGKSAACGPRGGEDIALKITQGWYPADIGHWDEEGYKENHEDMVHEIKCEERNFCRAAYNKTPDLRTACFQELNLIPKHRHLYQGQSIVPFNELVIYKMR